VLRQVARRASASAPGTAGTCSDAARAASPSFAGFLMPPAAGHHQLRPRGSAS
jgi:hypothetical protein